MLADYTRVLAQRNTWIKAVKSGEQRLDELLFDTLDERLAQSGAAVRRYRKDYVSSLSPIVTRMYSGLSSGREQMTLMCEERDGEDELLSALKASRSADLKAGFTTVGPHRDDLNVKLGNTSARSFGSQGQQRSAVLALKLAEATLLADGYGEKPVILLDDVMSELDSSRQEYILNHIEGFQVFITCCDATAVTKLAQGRVFHVQNGNVT